MTGGKGGRLVTERDGAVLRIALDNPGRRNAISAAMWQGLLDTAQALDGDRDIRVVVIAGSGAAAFAAGADISEFAGGRMGEAAAGYDDLVEAACRAVEAIPQPVIAAIRGICYGAGLSLAASCDFRLCDDTARFAVPAARVGLGYPPSGVRRFVHLLGPGAARELLLTGTAIDAARAVETGLVAQVTSPDGLEPAVSALCGRLCANAPMTMRALKAAVAAFTPDAARDRLAAAERLAAECNRSEDYREGIAAFAEKRPPRFRWK